MCNFFSFVTQGDGKPLYFTARQRSLKKLQESSYEFDSHSSIAAYFLKSPIADDKCNKYEYVKGKFVVDQINVRDDSKKAKKWIKQFAQTKDFEKICLAAVKQDRHALYYVKTQTPEICLAAVEQNGWALKYVETQTPEICLAAVEQNGWALQYVKTQTPEICLTAVQQNGHALEYVKTQTSEVCSAAVKQNGRALYYVKTQTPELCLAAVKQDGWALEYVNAKFKYLFEE